MAAKSIIVVSRRAGLTRAEFRDHYEQVHVPLALAWFGFEKYVRNFVAGDSDPGFDCVGEFWPHDTDQVARAATAAGSIFADDDAKFMSETRTGGAVEERLLAGPPRGEDAAGTQATLYLLRASSTNLPGLESWAEQAVSLGQSTRITVDIPVAGGGNLGDVLLLHSWGADALRPPFETLASAAVAVCDTPADTLIEARTRLNKNS